MSFVSERLEPPTISALEHKLMVSNAAATKPKFERLPRSSVMEKARSFLPEMAAANDSLQHQLQIQGAQTFDIEVVNEEEPMIEMDLACGVLELQNEQAIEAAERLMEGLQQAGREGGEPSSSCSTSSDSEDVDSELEGDVPLVVAKCQRNREDTHASEPGHCSSDTAVTSIRTAAAGEPLRGDVVGSGQVAASPDAKPLHNGALPGSSKSKRRQHQSRSKKLIQEL